MSVELGSVLTGHAMGQALSLVEGEISHIDENGVCFVIITHLDAPQRARVLASEAQSMCPGDKVLVALDASNEPLVIGLILDSVSDAKSTADSHVNLEGRESVTIKCGDSSITMQRDGNIVVRGKNIISRASGQNKVRGFSVKIN